MWFFLVGVLIVYTGKPASASCPIKVNPTIIEVKHGDTLSVNCSSLSDHDGMGWESTHGGISLQDSPSVLLHVAKVNFWTLNPKCYITLKNDSQCGQKLPVTVYKMPDSVSVSPPVTLEEGQQYHMQCDIVNVAPARLLLVYWHKDHKIIYNETFNDDTQDKVNKSSVITLTAHRDDNGARIWCEAKLGLQTVQEDTSKKSNESLVNILYSPAFTKPENETVELQSPKDKITLNCTASGNPKPSYSWRLPLAVQDANKNQIFNESLLTPSFQLPGSYVCTASNSQGTSTKYFTVQAKRDRTTFAAIVGGCVALGVVIAIVGLVFVKSDGTFSFNKGGYLSGQPTSSGVV